MEQFKIRPNGFNEIKKQVLVRTIPLMVIATAAGIAISVNGQQDSVNILPFVIPLAALAIGFGLYRGIERQRELFESYTLSISDNRFIRTQANTPTIEIAFGNVHEIVKNSNGSFAIKGATSTDLIAVPAQVENLDRLEAVLNAVMPIAVLNKPAMSQKLTLPFVLFTLALMVTVYKATNKLVVGVSGCLVTGIMVYSFITIQRSRNVDRKTKRASYWMILVLLSVIGMTLAKLSDF